MGGAWSRNAWCGVPCAMLVCSCVCVSGVMCSGCVFWCGCGALACGVWRERRGRGERVVRSGYLVRERAPRAWNHGILTDEALRRIVEQGGSEGGVLVFRVVSISVL